MKTKKLRVVVTANDISKGIVDRAQKVSRSRSCPIAQSLIRRGFEGVSVGSSLASYIVGGKRLYFSLPSRAADFVQQADINDQVDPMTFTMKFFYCNDQIAM